MMKLMSIAGARPNFMKLAALAHAIESFNRRIGESDERIEHIIVHTGQHYDEKMSSGFFDDLNIPRPDVNLGVGSGTHASQTSNIMQLFEPVLLKYEPDILLVVGDVNSTIACTLVASKIEYPAESSRKRPTIVHVEAGLRSFDRDMPEEINRILTDAISDHLFVTEQSGIDNLRKEGVAEEKIHLVGNVMIDTLQQHIEKASKSDVLARLGIVNPYALVTLHRPSNVDTYETLEPIIRCLLDIAKLRGIVFPVHPRTKNSLIRFDLWRNLEDDPNVVLSEPQGYLDFLQLVKNADMVITDSGGIQEETTVLKIPCVTLRNNTERPVTVAEGTNYLIGTSPALLQNTVSDIISGKMKASRVPDYWDGKAADRIVKCLLAI
jgi:UDP-N-acetylglucosamine 2-epimerase (non-hydrolysing)